MSGELIVRGLRVVLDDGVGPAALHIEGGRIVAISGYDEIPREAEAFEAGKSVVMPGLVDTHVHVNEPGRTAWEGFASATRSAAAGGITTLIDMPLNCVPPTINADALEEKRAAARGQCWIDVGFWGGVVPGNASELEPLARAGVVGCKAFLVPSGVDEFPHVGKDELSRALAILGEAGLPLLVHAELPGPIEEAEAALSGSSTDYATFLASRPRTSENLAIALMIELCAESGAPVHIVHHSSADALPLLRAAKAQGLPITAETCPHYLHLTAEDIAAGATQFKCAPPIREAENRERLWDGLASGVLDMIVSDHSPCTAALKHLETGDFMTAWGGIASLQLTLPIAWTEARTRGFDVEELARWMCRRTAELAGLGDRKGRIAVGHDADLCIWRPESSFRVDPEALFHKNPVTPYAGELLYGSVEATLLAGEVIYHERRFGDEPRGKLIKRS